MITLTELNEPICQSLSNFDLLNGSDMPDIDRLKLFSDSQFEGMVSEWAWGCLKHKYPIVLNNAGAGDKGRDIICYYDNKKKQTDIYQCKHYNHPIMPSEIYIEIGKLLYYTFNKDYQRPKKYYLVSSQGCGTKLRDLINSPTELKKELIKNWDDKCKNKISQTMTIKLEGIFKDYVDKFDLSIIEELPILELLTEYEKTNYYPKRFGIRHLKRPQAPKPSSEIQKNELNYIQKLYNAYGSATGKEVKKKNDLEFHHSEHLECQRESFYSAEGLKMFSRDALPPNELYKNLQDEVILPVKSELLINSYKDGLDCLSSAIKIATTIQIGGSLHQFVTTKDRIGILHQQANEETNFKWVK